MKEEKEFVLLSKLYNSKYVKGFISKKGGFLSDFERICNRTRGDKAFRDWLKGLIENGILIKQGKDKNDVGVEFNTYLINKGAILKRIGNMNLWDSGIKNMVYDHYEGVLRH